MSKRSEETIVEDTRKILTELQKNAKENINTIAEHCGFTRQKVWRTIKQLEAKDQIWGYTAIFDEQKIGLKHFVMMFKKSMKQLEEKTVDKIVSRKMEDVAAKIGIIIESSFYVHGEYDWVATFTAKDIKQAKKFSDLFFTMYPGVVEKIAILQTMMFIRKQYILNPERKKLKNYL
jgi:DNA-binding Lrp family transcriptional regulator